MSEYIYHKGIISFKEGRAKDAFKKLTSTEYGKLAKEANAIKLKGDTIQLNTINIGSYPVSYLVEFNEVLKSLIPDIKENQTLEQFLFGEGYYKLSLDTDKNDIVYTKVSDADPHKDEQVIKPGEKVAIFLSEENVLEELNEKINDENVEKVIEEYFEVVRKALNRGDRVSTPLGTLIKAKSKIKGEGDIPVFEWSEKL